MNHSIYTADKATHLKVVIAGLLAGTAIVATTLTVHLAQPELSLQKATTLAVYQARPMHARIEMAQR
ncbi:hypothetical protein CVM73_31910 [Bradyrhizobium forestalis]|uniref:Uncharacterized protein n=1 Tax=Bradyrhizobium forestalis TaxID=1419263 RepID=A0A2M8R074_9BRAD|nr:hypothetical protein [Bradyrhizobium forestalis]PJG51226.1 hypothetical protein CVM73_31910 [Bradyrhizobium forestalis]